MKHGKGSEAAADVDIYKKLIPALASQPDAYKAVMSSADLLGACFKLFVAKRDAFAALLVDAQGEPAPHGRTQIRYADELFEAYRTDRGAVEAPKLSGEDLAVSAAEEAAH